MLEALIMLTESDVKELTVGQQKLLIKGVNVAKSSMDDTAKGGLTQF